MIGAIANVLETIVAAIVGVSTYDLLQGCIRAYKLIQVIVTIFDVILDILCCRCGRRRTTTTRGYRRGWGRRRAVGTGRTAGGYY